MTAREADTHQTKGRSALVELREGNTTPMSMWLREHLFDHVLPFWDPLVDEDLGGLFTCVKDDGEILTRDKWMWSQWRAVWVFARIYNTLDPSPKWRDRAQRIAEFCIKYGKDQSERGWALLLAEKGEIKRGAESIYADAFAVYGLVELATATGNRSWLTIAKETADDAIDRIETMGERLPHFPYSIPKGGKPHGVPMIWSLKLAALAVATGEKKYADVACKMMDEVWTDFYDRESGRIFEVAGKAGGPFAGAPGQATVPGHVIEGLWFQRLVASGLGREARGVTETWQVVQKHFDLGWDSQMGGGLLLAVGLDGKPTGAEAWPFGETKLWWPQTEALFASLLGWWETGDSAWLKRYEQTWELCWKHYVDWEIGEWRQKLHRDLTPLTGTIALPVKDPFHLPRSLILQIELLENKKPPRLATVFS
jgi:N-acylglucosamine 2-epimerase